MTVEERKAKLQEIKEKVESWQASLSEMLELMETEYEKINKEFIETKEEPTPEESEIAREINKIEDIKTREFVDKWYKDNSQPNNEKEIEHLEWKLFEVCQEIENMRRHKKDERYKKDEAFRQKVDEWDEKLAPNKLYKEKLLFVNSRYYEKKKTSSSNTNPENSKNKNATLPWVLAIAFGIIAAISTGIAIYFYWHQRKIKRFKV